MKWLEFAKAQKAIWTKVTKNRNMPPIIVASRNEEPIVSVMAPQCNKYMALSAASLCRTGMAADSIAFITDGFSIKRSARNSIEIYNLVKDGKTSLQELYEAGNPSIGECITAVLCENGKCKLSMVEYQIANNEVVWGDSDETEEIGGFISEQLLKIMREKTVLEMEVMQQAAAQLGLDSDPERQLHHSGRAIRKILHAKDFLVMEWIPWDEKEGYGTLLERLAKKFQDLDGVYDIDNMMSLHPSMN